MSKRVEPGHDVGTERRERGCDCAVLRRQGAERAVAVPGDHRRRPREEVPEIVAELALVALVDARDRGRAVLAERDRPRAPEPDRIGAIDLEEIERVDDVPERLRDLLVVEQQVPVDEQLLRRLVSGCEQQCGPVDAMKAQDVLREQVPDRRPERPDQVLTGARIRQRADVVDEGVRPDVGDRIRIPRDRDAPRLAGAADREVLEATLDEAARLVRPESRQDEVGALVQLEQLLLEGREAEEPVALLDPLRHRVVLGALSVDEIVLGLERLAADAIQPGVHVLVDVPVVVQRLQESLHEPLVLLVARADEEVVRRIEAFRELTPDDRDLVGVLLRGQALLRRDARDLRGVLVDPGQEERFDATLTLVAGEDVRRDRRVRMPDVRGRVHVVDRCGDVEALHSH